jgi:hypothetical protein
MILFFGDWLQIFDVLMNKLVEMLIVLRELKQLKE